MTTYTGTTGDDVLVSTNTTVLTQSDTLTGLAGDDLLVGGVGNDTLDGGSGSNAMYGGIGNDVYFVSSATDTINENAGEGTDTVITSVSFDLSPFDNVENITAKAGSTLGVNLTGNDGNNVLDGSLNTAANVLTGGLGDDTYVIGAADTIVENLGEGTDTVKSATSIDLSLGAFSNVENATLTGTAAGNLTGTALVANILTGNSGINIFNDGGVGAADTMNGGGGTDTYFVNNAADVVVGGSGVDFVSSSVSFNLATNGTGVEKLTLTGGGNIDATGNALINVLTGNTGNNTLDGGAGADTLIGGSGNDTYVVDLITDKITEVVLGGGTDTVIFNGATVGLTYLLAAGLENLTLGGVLAINGTGNTAANVITGNSGNNILSDGGVGGTDSLIGGLGNDTYIVNNAADVVTEILGEGTADQVTFNGTVAAYTYVLGANIEKLVLGGALAINGTGNLLANIITGNGAANTLDDGGIGGIDTLNGGLGNDIYVVHNATDVINEAASAGTDTVQFYAANPGDSYALGANLENLTLFGNVASIGTGTSGNNILIGDAGDNTLIGGGGTDVMKGGAGNDSYVVDSTSDVISELNGPGIDSVTFNGAGGTGTTLYTLSAYVENLTLGTGVGDGGSVNLNGTGNAQANVVMGNAGNNILNGSGGIDTVSYANAAGGVTVDLSVTTIQTTGGAGNDTLSNFENLTGSAWNDNLTGSAGNNVIDGGAGNDVMTGNGGTDTASYASSAVGVTVDLSNVGAQVTGNGTDTLSGFANLTGSSHDDVLSGDSGNNVLDGGLGNDTVSYANASSAVLVDLSVTTAQNTFGAGTDTITNFENVTGSTFDDALYGDSGNNTLDGGGDIFGDYLNGGGSGNDTYVIHSGNEVVDGGIGTDTLTSSQVSLDLTSLNYFSVENATLTGSSNLNLTGDGVDNVLIGNAGDNNIIGNGGNDTLDAGTAGTDVLTGGAGNDTYIVDHAGVTVTEAGGGGTADEVQTSLVTYTLDANVENLTLLTGGVYGVGNSLNNIITGNSGDNTLDGSTGADALVGGDGNDIYYLDNVGDVVTETLTGGTDIVYTSVNNYVLEANVENLALLSAGTATGNGLDNIISGTAGADVLNGVGGNDTLRGGLGTDSLDGGLGNDTLDGGDGNDSLTGGAGADTFAFTSAPGAGVDTVTDFNAGQGDKLDISFILTGYVNEGTDPLANFVSLTDDTFGNTIVAVDLDGSTGGVSYTTIALVTGGIAQGLTGDPHLIDGTLLVV